jgi:predicted alpha/beta-hydrolase family hydrolase
MIAWRTPTARRRREDQNRPESDSLSSIDRACRIEWRELARKNPECPCTELGKPRGYRIASLRVEASHERRRRCDSRADGKYSLSR